MKTVEVEERPEVSKLSDSINQTVEPDSSHVRQVLTKMGRHAQEVTFLLRNTMATSYRRGGMPRNILEALLSSQSLCGSYTAEILP